MLALNFLSKWHIYFYHENYKQAFRLFQFSFFLVKIANLYEVHIIFQDIEHQFQENIFIIFFIIFFYEIFSKFRSIFDPFKLFTGSFCNISQSCKFFTSQYLRYGQWSSLYLYNKVLHFHQILVLQTHTKIHTLQFYLDLILISLKKQAYS